MPSSIRAFVSAHRKLVIGLVLVAAVGGYVGYSRYRKAEQPATYVLAAAQKGTLVTTVNGSGQVSVSDQIDVKPKASGDVVSVETDQGKDVKAGDVLIRLDSRDAAKAVRDAQTSLASAKLAYDKLVQPADALTLAQAENAVSSATRSLAQAKEAQAQLPVTTAQTLSAAYEDGYNSASDAFIDIPNQMKDLKDLRGTDAVGDQYVSDYKNILGQNSPLVLKWVADHDAAVVRYNQDFLYFKSVPRTADDATRYALIARTLETEQAVSQALQSAHAMLDAVVNTTYKEFTIAATVDAMRPKIASDISTINGDISATQRAKDTIDTTTRNAPVDQKKADDAVTAAEENLKERTESLAKLKAGPDPLDIQSQKLSLKQRQDALIDAQEKLADYVVRAPIDGTVAKFSLKKGDSVSSGTAVATIITPQKFAEISLNEVDAVKVKQGDKATLAFDAIEGLGITGEVADVDLLGTVSQGVVTYNARIVFDTQDTRVRSGMSLNASVIIGVAQDVLLVPNAAVKTQNGVHYVQTFDASVPRNGSGQVVSLAAPNRTTVEIGESNDTSTIITSGLKEGDEVVVREIAASASGAASSSGVRIPGLPGAGGGNVQFRAGGAFGR
ncbi:MAG TPA: efflux RND transporter periplasmic adaptor subunit [Patescibacteria group bacterium]|nr:efflux RND transporter periplasmic adaptor subunit [Patescibacteria group bacterium]